MHIGTRDNKLTGEFAWWTCGNMLRQKWIDTTNVERQSILLMSPSYQRDLVRATFRDVREQEEPMFVDELEKREVLRLLAIWRSKIETRAIAKYGAGSTLVDMLLLGRYAGRKTMRRLNRPGGFPLELPRGGF